LTRRDLSRQRLLRTVVVLVLSLEIQRAPVDAVRRRQLSRELDWCIKRELILAYMARKGVAWDDQRIPMMDLQFHDIKRSRGLYYLLCKQGLVDRMITDAQIEEAMYVPPQTTRAKIRSDFIRFANERNRSYDVGWSYLKLNDRYQRTILCKDPFQSWDPRVEEMIASYY